jgi:molybdate transport system substrate-binding protein
MRAGRVIILTLICIAVMACVLVFVRAGQAGTSLTVHAGAGIRPPLDEAGKMFEKKTGTRVEYNYKGSGCLLADICFSKRGDVYIPGELYYVEQAGERGFIGTSLVVAQMSTVVVVQKGNPKKIKGLKDLTRPGLRIGLGDPTKVAIGRAANESLVKAGILKDVEKNVVMRALNVVEMGIGVKLEHLDAAIVWDATAYLFKGDVETLSLPDEWRVDSPIPAGVLSFSKQRSQAEQFVKFLATEEVAKVFRAHGYGVPEQKATAIAKN